MHNERLTYLFHRWLDKTYDEPEKQELFQALRQEDAASLLQSIREQHENYRFKGVQLGEQSSEEMRYSLLKMISADKQKNNPARIHRVHFLKTAWFKYAAAVLIMIGTGTYLWNTFTKPSPTLSMKNIQHDVLPGKDGAILTLADGKQIVLDSLDKGIIANENGTKVLVEHGQLIYKAEGAAAVSFNTMSTPMGRQFQVVLPDGTKVWLNAASSITYPTAFTEKERKVSVSGEVYFEVAKNKHRPFKIATRGQLIEVLGTSFNINAYTDEPFEKTSLVEGAIKVNHTILRPGQAYQEGAIVSTNTSQDVAWKNGVFSFDKADLPAVMRQLSRWYNIEVVYRGVVPAREFSGEIGRSLTLMQVLEILGRTRIKYTIESNNRIVILP